MSTRSVLVLLLLASLAGCRRDQERPRPAEKAADPGAIELTALDCSSAGPRGTGITARAPAGSTCKEVGETLVIATPQGVELVVHDLAGEDMPGRRQTIQTDESRPFKRFTVDTPESLVYETLSPSGQITYDFISQKKVGDRTVTCEGRRDATYTREQAEQLAVACQSIEKK
jgi:hypothetical protein